MKVLITGATGYIGAAVAEATAAAGHGVMALAHTPAAGERARRNGWQVRDGDLRDVRRLEHLAREVDAVIHAANAGGVDAAAVDTAATRAFLRGMAGTGKPFVYTSGVWVLGAGETDEASPVRAVELVAWRGALEGEVLAAAPGVRSVVLRPGIVFGRNGGIPGMIASGDLPVIGTGSQRWPLVHVDDLADLYVRALQAPPSSILHGVATTLTSRELALLARRGEAPRAISLEEGRARFGAFADALGLDQKVRSVRTMAAVGWRPRLPSPILALLEESRAA